MGIAVLLHCRSTGGRAIMAVPGSRNDSPPLQPPLNQKRQASYTVKTITSNRKEPTMAYSTTPNLPKARAIAMQLLVRD